MDVTTPLTQPADDADVTTSLTQLAAEDAARADDAIQALTSRLGADDADLTQRQAEAAEAAAALAARIDEEAAIREKLARAPLPADAEDLASALETTLVQRQYAVGAAARTADALGSAERRRAADAAALDAARRTQTSARTAEKLAQQDANRVAKWSAAAEDKPVTDALGSASQALTAAPYTEARARLDTVLGAAFVELFLRRATDAAHHDAEVADRLHRARTARWSALTALGDPSGTVLSARHTYSTEVARLRAIAEGAPAQYGEALNALAAVKGGAAPTPQEQQRMDVLSGHAEGAPAQEKALYDARDKLRTAEAHLDDAVLAALRNDPDIDPDTSPDLEEQRHSVADARHEVDTARAALDALQADLDKWEASLPDALKGQILVFLTADTVLRELADVNVQQRIHAVTDARDALVLALRKAAKADAVAVRLADEVAARTGDTDAWTTVAAARRATLVRGEA